MKIKISGCNIIADECDLEKGVVVMETKEHWSVRFDTGKWREPAYVINDGDEGALLIRTMRMPLAVAPQAANSIRVLELNTMTLGKASEARKEKAT